MVKSEVGAEFSLQKISGQVDEFYLHVESSLFLPSQSQSNGFYWQTANAANAGVYSFRQIASFGLLAEQSEQVSSTTTTVSIGAIIGYSLAGVAGFALIGAGSFLVWKTFLTKATNVGPNVEHKVGEPSEIKWQTVSQISDGISVDV